VPYFPRFRALALLGRLTLVRVDGLVMQASENLHTFGRQHPPHRRVAVLRLYVG
jgi:hypothetical protein